MGANDLFKLGSDNLIDLFLPIGSIFLGRIRGLDATETDTLKVCNGAEIARSDYPILFNLFSTETQEVNGVTKTLLEIYGEGDGLTTFNLPNYSQQVPTGAGLNATDSIADHDEYYVGEFKDDQFQDHRHATSYWRYGGDSGSEIWVLDGGNNWVNTWTTSYFEVQSPKEYTFYLIVANYNYIRTGSVTRGKRISADYLIRVK